MTASKVKKLVLANSGGLDTSVILKWLQTACGAEVVISPPIRGRGARSSLRAPMLASVMATDPASKLIAPITDRMPAILEDADWATWLAETPAAAEQVKATLRTMEGVNWKMAKEPKPEKAKQRNTTKARAKAPPIEPLL